MSHSPVIRENVAPVISSEHLFCHPRERRACHFERAKRVEKSNLITMYKTYYIYILSNKSHSTLYIGMTNDLERRIMEHRSNNIPGFTQRYNCHKLLYYESYSDANQALDREKQLKKWGREKKERLIRSMNPDYKDLAEDFSTSASPPLEMTI